MSPKAKKTLIQNVTTQSENLLHMSSSVNIQNSEFDYDPTQYPPSKIMTVEEKMWDIMEKFPIEKWPMQKIIIREK